MDLSIHIPCTCIIDDDPVVLANKIGKVDVQVGRKCRVIEGKYKEVSFDKILLRSAKITVSGVELIIDRCACHEMLKIQVCKGSRVCLKNFFDIFPEMILESEGQIRQFNYDGRFIVGKLTIGMNPDYSNDSSIVGFQVVNKLDIKYQYNGIIQGHVETHCLVKRPDDVCMGKSSKINIKNISNAEQLKLTQSRSTHSYNILTNINDPDESVMSICAKCSEILPCFKLKKCDHIICNVCIKQEHINSGCNITSPYFNCPIAHCRKKVIEIAYIEESDIVSQTDEES